MKLPQAQHPSGLQGRLFGKLMEWLNTPSYRRAIELIDPAPGDSLLEVGFGTGALLSMLAPHMQGGLLAGLDLSALMVRQAERRLRVAAPDVRLDLRQGSDGDISWPSGHFSHVTALHSFQFWPDPDATLQRIHEVLRPNGQLTLILRSHARNKPDWLPNPISRSRDEVGGTRTALHRAGFERIERHSDVGTSSVFTALAPRSGAV